MSPVAQFELVLVLLVAVACLGLAARWLRLPPAVALILGGGALAFVPGMPVLTLDPELVLVLFLPPLLTASAYFTVWRDFRRNLSGILGLAIGAVAFTTLLVGVAVHWAAPELPWAACFALGAVVSPPDAVAAKAVLEHVRLPRQTMVLLEGESLLNDAAGIVLFRFAVAAALTGTFSLVDAAASFAVLALGGIIVGGVVGLLCIWAVRLLKRLRELEIGITTTLLMPWAAYIGAERIHASGVIATVVSGLLLGWYQHEVFGAKGRHTGTAVWQVMVYLLEAFVFILIGLSLRGVIERLGGAGDVVQALGGPVLTVVSAVVLTRFAWILGADRLAALHDRFRGDGARPSSLAASAVMGWAGMRGVVTLAVALSVPEEMPGRDLILVSAFAVILMTVLVQGTTLGALIRLLRLDATKGPEERLLTRAEAASRVAAVQLETVETLARGTDGQVHHPRLLEEYGYRARAAQRFSQDAEILKGERDAHFEVVLAAVAAGRAEVLRLHRFGQIHDEVLHALEHDLDLQELSAERMRGEG
ncbi:Na+/H+ antiporter [Paracraurococcus lichenis]|uniref:Na+/H+ antiporter n=1 Tax=Paracraurococcus lichenis TaxID=3064888 RepID=A0ABT9ED69_9PROT|nr:Na+/H+ antiporter [Paracraurococcus sp. LOR1-02]MDO9714057.1 Na+/H+ antiporter [Paracraurococcus sp. LOR1-02]